MDTTTTHTHKSEKIYHMWLLSVMTEITPYFPLPSEQLAVDGTDSHASLHDVFFSVVFCFSVETL